MGRNKTAPAPYYGIFYQNLLSVLQDYLGQEFLVVGHQAHQVKTFNTAGKVEFKGPFRGYFPEHDHRTIGIVNHGCDLRVVQVKEFNLHLAGRRVRIGRHIEVVIEVAGIADIHGHQVATLQAGT